MVRWQTISSRMLSPQRGHMQPAEIAVVLALLGVAALLRKEESCGEEESEEQKQGRKG